MNLFLDTETTGIPNKMYPGKKLDWRIDYEFYPYVLELAWKYRSKMNRHLIYQEGREVPKHITKINGITTKMANDRKKTVLAEDIYPELIMNAMDAGTIIGHNIYFDTSIVSANVLREFGADSREAELVEQAFHKDKRLDTMRATIRLIGKWPTLTELYEFLFKCKFEGAHGAGYDVLATEKCFVELKRRRLI